MSSLLLNLADLISALLEYGPIRRVYVLLT